MIKKTKGFTLIELLVVVAIISLLTSVVLASLQGSRDKAATARVLSEKRSLEVAIQLFMLDNNGEYPNPGDTSMRCLASGGCLWANSAVSLGFTGDLAQIESTEDMERFTLIRKAQALVGGNLPTGLSPNPTIIANGQQFRGPIYQCTDITSGSCRAADLYWTIKSVCPTGTDHLSYSTGSVCTSDPSGSAAASVY